MTPPNDRSAIFPPRRHAQSEDAGRKAETRHPYAARVRKLEEEKAELAARIDSLARDEELSGLLSAVLEQAADAIVIADAAGTLLWTNAAFTRLTGYATAEVRGKTFHLLGGGGHDHVFGGSFWPTLLGGKIWRSEIINRRKDGTLQTVELVITPVRAGAGAITHFVANLMPVKPDRGEVERGWINRRMELLLESTIEGIYGVDLDGRCTFINRAGAEMLGRTPAEILGQPMHPLVQPLRRDRSPYPAELGPIAAVLRDGVRCEIDAEEVFWRADGASFPVEYRANPMFDGGTIVGAVVTFTDVTEKKKLEHDLLRAQRVESVGRLASGIAHDMNNILAPILMSAPLLRLGLSPEDTEQTLQSIESSAKRGADLVRQLLLFGRGMEGERAPVDTGDLIREILKVARETFPKNITITFEAPPSTWPVRGDASQLHQVLLNLCVNARDAMPRGGTLTVTAGNVHVDDRQALEYREAKPGTYVRLSVSDTGTGMPPEIADRIFEPFFTTKGVGMGTGLGLSTVLGIVKSHDGFVALKTEVDRGTTFEIFFPATPADERLLPKPALLPPRGNGELILVVDDEESIRRVLRETLAHHNYRVLTANDGAEGAAVFAGALSEVQLVLTDVDMPFLDGVELVKILRRIHPTVKILVSSGLSPSRTDDRLGELKAQQVSAFVRKPYAAEEILFAVHAALTGQPAGDSAA